LVVVGGVLFGIVVGWIVGIFRPSQLMPLVHDRIMPIAAGLLHLFFGVTASAATAYQISGFSGVFHVLAGVVVGYVLRSVAREFRNTGIHAIREWGN
jgi:hypothetical protein